MEHPGPLMLCRDGLRSYGRDGLTQVAWRVGSSAVRLEPRWGELQEVPGPGLPASEALEAKWNIHREAARVEVGQEAGLRRF